MFESESSEGLSARDFVLRELRSDPDLTYPEVRSRGAKIGLNVPPFLYGSARRALDLPAQPARSELTAGVGGNAAAAAREPSVADDGDAGDDADAEISASRGSAEGGADGGAAEVTNAAAPRAAAPRSSAFQFAVETLRLSPDIAFGDLKARAAMAGLKLPPIVYGRAKAMLGLVPTRPRRPKAPAVDAPRSLRQVDSAAALSAMPAPAAASAGLRQLEQLFGSIRALEAENRHLRNAIAAARSAAAAALEMAED